MKLGTERAVKRAIKKVLKQLQFMYAGEVGKGRNYAGGLWWFSPSASVYGRRGIPDFVCCVRGGFVCIEAKSEAVGAKGLTPLQIMEGRWILSAGGEYMVVWDEETIKNMEARLIILVEKGRNNVR